MSGWLIWVEGLRGPEPQKCLELPRSNANYKEYPLLDKHKLSEEEFELSLRELEVKYPAPPIW